MHSIQIKICGITSIEDANLLNQYMVDYAGFVLFFPKSKRNLTIAEAIPVMKALNPLIQKVAVVVNPTKDQVEEIEKAGFDIIQVHGILSEEVVEHITIPIFRAFHIEETQDIRESGQDNRFFGYVLDGKIPGAGKVFDWELTGKFDRQGKKLMLAGGLNAENVTEGILKVHPDIVDVSSGVEKEEGKGKDPLKIKAFVETVRAAL